MIAPANPNDDKQPKLLGGLGGSSLRPRGIRDTRMIERALRECWPIAQKKRRPIVERQVAIATDPESSPREATSAARCLASMSAENAAIALKLLDKVVPDQHEVNHTAEELRAVVDEACRDETYVRLQRERAAQYGAIAGTNGHNGHAGPLGNGKAPKAD